jgi:hypothetical protein
VIRVHTPKSVRDFPNGVRYLTEDEFNNVCVLDDRKVPIATFADGMWISVELVDDDE